MSSLTSHPITVSRTGVQRQGHSAWQDKPFQGSPQPQVSSAFLSHDVFQRKALMHTHSTAPRFSAAPPASPTTETDPAAEKVAAVDAILSDAPFYFPTFNTPPFTVYKHYTTQDVEKFCQLTGDLSVTHLTGLASKLGAETASETPRIGLPGILVMGQNTRNFINWFNQTEERELGRVYPIHRQQTATFNNPLCVGDFIKTTLSVESIQYIERINKPSDFLRYTFKLTVNGNTSPKKPKPDDPDIAGTTTALIQLPKTSTTLIESYQKLKAALEAYNPKAALRTGKTAQS